MPIWLSSRKKSTNDAIINTVTNVLSEINYKNNVLGVFLDLLKAFDCVNINTLCEMLEKMGIRGKAGQWVNSFLTHRFQCVVLDSKEGRKLISNFSEMSEVMYGVPQGSILGPFLFVLYVNVIPSFIQKYHKNCKPVVYC